MSKRDSEEVGWEDVVQLLAIGKSTGALAAEVLDVKSRWTSLCLYCVGQSSPASLLLNGKLHAHIAAECFRGVNVCPLRKHLETALPCKQFAHISIGVYVCIVKVLLDTAAVRQCVMLILMHKLFQCKQA